MAGVKTGHIVLLKPSKRMAWVLLGSTALALPMSVSPAVAQSTCSFIAGYEPSSFPEILVAPADDVLSQANCGSTDQVVEIDEQAARGSDGSNAIIGSGDAGGAGENGKHIVLHNNSSGAIYNQNGGAGLVAISIGGNGGNGGGSDTIGSGGDGGAGGNGGFVVVANAGTISTTANDAPAIVGISQGGQGGAGGSGGFIGSGGNGGRAGNSGDQVVAFNSGEISTVGNRSNGITAQSVGGVGGEGGQSRGTLLTIGGNGAAGGQGGEVTVTNQANFRTRGDDSKGISARSIGGGGGQGGSAFSASLFGGMALGGYGGGGGDASTVTVNNNGNIFTEGFRSTGIKAQSIGGGGGDGGAAGSVTAGTSVAFSLAMGGSGGNGGNGGDVNVNLAQGSQIVTGDSLLTGPQGTYFIPRFDFPNIWPGENSIGVVAQSIGGGGGHGGSALAIAGSASPTSSISVSAALAGNGGGGGSAGEVNVNSAANIQTYGRHASGIVAQSIGGGGGIGGNVTAVQASIGELSGSINFNLAGAGGTGGTSGVVTVSSSGSVNTLGDNSAAVIAQSIAGGGGAGGNSFDSGNAIGQNSVSVGVNMGGSGGAGHSALNTALTHNGGQITTYGNQSAGFVGQSIGGGGGHGGSVHTYSVTVQGGTGRALNASVGLGGSGGNGGSGGESRGTVKANSNLATYGTHASGLHLQSIGGGGGVGGNVFAFDASASVSPSEDPSGNEGQNLSSNVSIGGSGGTGGDGGFVDLYWDKGSYSTAGLRSSGVVLQSVGGGGGAGGNVHSFSVNTSVPISAAEFENRAASAFSLITDQKFKFKPNLNVTVDIGGSGAQGGEGGEVVAELSGGTITTSGHQSHGLVAQSVGGGGGMGGNSIADGFAGIGTYDLSLTLGGSGGTGGSGGAVRVSQYASTDGLTQITTSGDHSHGVLAQSVGGGGGEAGSTHTSFIGIPLLAKSTANLTIGGSGGSGGVGGAVSVSDIQATTSGSGAHGVLAQSIGGGGGTGGSSGASGITIALGRSGGDGNHGGTVQLSNVTATTNGGAAVGILAQSIGGGGGNIGAAKIGALTKVENAITSQFTVSGSGGDGGNVTIGCQDTSADCGVAVTTSGATAFGILAQSIGGGGGAAQVTDIPLDLYTLKVNGEAPGNGSSGKVTIADTTVNPLSVTTKGAGAMGIVAQSIDSGGAIFMSDTEFAKGTYSGNAPGPSVNGGVLVDLNGSVTTNGENADAIYVQTLSHAFTQFTVDGDNLLGSGNTNNAVAQILLNSNSSINTAGYNSNGLNITTNSNAAAAAQPVINGTETAYGAGRAQTINLQGDIRITGGSAWGVNSTNNIATNSVAADLATTHVVMGPGAQITMDDVAAGGILVNDGGNAVLDIFGTISSFGVPEGDPPPTAIAVTASNITMNFGQSATINGAVYVTLNDDKGKAYLSSDSGSFTGGLFVTSNGGYVDIDMTNGSIIASPQKTDYDVFERINDTVLSIDTTNANMKMNGAFGVISGAAIVPGSGDAAKLVNYGNFFGTIDGAFNYVAGAINTYHQMTIHGAGGPSDYINVVSFDASGGAQPVGWLMNLYALPTPDFKPFDIIRVSHSLASSDPINQQFALAPDGLATKMNFAYSSAPDAIAKVTLNSISIDFTQVGLTGNDAQTAQLANAQVNAIASGATTPDLTSTLYKYLLRAANEGDLPDLQSDLSKFNAALQYSNQESAAAAAANATDNLQSCGGKTKASVNPLAQGECHWAKVTYARGKRDGGNHRDTATGFAWGHQFALTDRLFLGLAANYEQTEFVGPGTYSEGDRLGAGAVMKFTDGKSFASISTHASYGWSDAVRKFTLAVEPASPRMAKSKQDSFALMTRFRGGRLFEMGKLDVIPTMEVDVPMVFNSGYTETGAGEFNLRVASHTDVLVDLHPLVELGSDFALGKANIRAVGKLGHRFSLNDVKSRVSLANGFNSSFAAEFAHRRERSLWTYGLGLIVDLSNRIETRLSYEIDQGDQDRNERFSFKAAYKF